jgi:hypothetical protein
LISALPEQRSDEEKMAAIADKRQANQESSIENSSLQLLPGTDFTMFRWQN